MTQRRINSSHYLLTSALKLMLNAASMYLWWLPLSIYLFIFDYFSAVGSGVLSILQAVRDIKIQFYTLMFVVLTLA